MLAESLSSATSLAWLVFTTGILSIVLLLPTAARFLRRGLPPNAIAAAADDDPSVRARRDGSVVLEPVTFGLSLRARRSPRHAVQQYRTLLAGIFSTLLAGVAWPGLLALRSLGAPALQVAMAFAFPTLLVVLHARRRAVGR